ncbi:hypothetical protein E1287_05170 [Actinomadura sp. KC06]|uniref:hypothetical protein n=1 Tax=Actinomadura sp. KC06 TaxID=2530369 RepID=UPI00104876E4|nr:hypothetical protein [Actinomadura sp. KC06]TDD38671.1 hypothetical protein E1287_05170 [Actinomadura sp. KC06]
MVSVLPSAVLVFYVYLLISSGAWSGPPDWKRAATAVTGIGVGTAAALSVLSLLAGLVLHPLQFALVQVYEGYWGTSKTARLMATRRAMRRCRYVEALRDEERDINDHFKEHPELSVPLRHWLMTTHLEAGRVSTLFPKESELFMPTRLGNVLRRYETESGKPYKLNTIQVVPLLALVGQEKDVEYLNDQRGALDLAVRMSVTSLIACAFSIAFLWQDGLWLMISLIPYGLAYLFYRGAVVTAREYGTAIAALILLNRRALYERLGIPKPADTREERLQNEDLQQLLDHKARADLSYEPEPELWWQRLDKRLFEKPDPGAQP